MGQGGSGPASPCARPRAECKASAASLPPAVQLPSPNTIFHHRAGGWGVGKWSPAGTHGLSQNDGARTGGVACEREKIEKCRPAPPVDAEPAPPPPAPEGALPPRIGQALAQLGKPPPRPASVSARSTDCIFYLSQGLSGQLAAGCAAAQPQYHIPPIPYYLRRGSHGVGTGDGRRDRRGIAQSAMT